MADQQALTPFDECHRALKDEANNLELASRAIMKLRNRVGNIALKSDELEVKQDDDGRNVLFIITMRSNDAFLAEDIQEAWDFGRVNLDSLGISLDKSSDYTWYLRARVEVNYR